MLLNSFMSNSLVTVVYANAGFDKFLLIYRKWVFGERQDSRLPVGFRDKALVRGGEWGTKSPRIYIMYTTLSIFGGYIAEMNAIHIFLQNLMS